MLTTTSEYKTEISKTGRHFLNKIIINETEYTGIKNFSYHGGTNSSDHISIGDAVSAYIEFTLTDYPSKMLTGQIATAYIGLQLSDSVEWIKMGIFHLDKPKRNGNYLDITAYDNFSLMEKGFYSDLSGNQKIVDILNEQCNKIGISFVGGADDVYYNVDLLKGSSVREAVAILAAYCGKNAIINRDGNLKFVWFDDIGVTLTDDYYNDTIEFDEEDTVIKRLDCTNETETLSIGTGIGVVFSCPGMTQERLNVLYNRINGFTYRAVSFDWQRARPDIEAGDMINLTIQGNNCAVPLMDFIVSCDGGCYGSIESKGKTQEEQDHEFTSPSEARYNFVYEEVISVKKVMADTIDAWQGNFESIETNFLTVNQKITALEGEFGKINVDELTARIATIEQAYISKAEVEELYATKAEIGILDADVANIKTLLAGSTTTGDLQSIVINSKNAIIENGTIKNAMIESLAFDKITGVDINTTKLTVHSDDGKSTWMDNTIQISDATRVRVQIGKDASNDYNIYIWDKTGKLMFDATGVTADGIQRPIIRDDMVSDTANINGKKINIQSVVKEINNGTEKIKSSTVLYDPTGQTLNIAFNELITTVDGIDEKVESNTTQISVANGEISTLISKTTQMQTDLSSAQGNITDLSTKYNQMKQTVDSYGVTIGEHTSQIITVRDDLDNLQVGGRNLALKTKESKTITGRNISNQTGLLYSLTDYKVLNESEGYTMSFDYELKKDATGSKLAFGMHSSPWVRYQVSNLTAGKHHFSIFIKIYTWTDNNIGYRLDNFATDNSITISNFKIEKGNKATDWTPAPEDIESSITEVSDKQSSMQLDLDGFKTSVSNTYATKTQLNTVDGKFANYSTTTQMNSAIQQSANTITQKVSAVESEVTTIDGKVTNLTDRFSTVESKLTATSLITTISSGINGGIPLSTTKFIMDKNGLHIKGGGLDISNNAGTKVLSADTSGNLVIVGDITAVNGAFGDLKIYNNAIGLRINDTNYFEMIPSDKTIHMRSGEKLASWNIDGFNIYGNDSIGGASRQVQCTITNDQINFQASDASGYNARYGINEISLTTPSVSANIRISGSQLTFTTTAIDEAYFDSNIKSIKEIRNRYFILKNSQLIQMTNASGTNIGKIGHGTGNHLHVTNQVTNGDIYIEGREAYICSKNDKIILANSSQSGYNAYFMPSSDGKVTLGLSNNRFRQLYASSSSIVTSDERQKHNIIPINQINSSLGSTSYENILESFFYKLIPKVFCLNDENSIENDKIHIGFIAQDVERSLNDLGIDAENLYLLNHYIWVDKDTNESKDLYGLAYEEFIALNTHMIQKLKKQVDDHNQEISYLKSEVARLQAKFDAYINGTIENKRA